MRILLANDDGPPGPESPYIFGFFLHLTRDLGFQDVKVVIPSSQKSWIGKAYHIKELTQGVYFYPRLPDGKGETSPTPRPLKDGEIAEWILLDGTPATCVNIALHSDLFEGTFDLVLSGPNLGRNSSAAFAMSSGTLGAAHAASLSGVRSIAVSYGTVHHPTPNEYFDPAHRLTGRIVKHLVENWGEDKDGLRDGKVDLYNLNIPLIETLLTESGLDIYWTTMWRNSYGRLFKQVSSSGTSEKLVNSAGPDALGSGSVTGAKLPRERSSDSGLLFKWSPQKWEIDMTGIVENAADSLLPEGTDGWALNVGAVSVTPLRSSFAEAPGVEHMPADHRLWKMKL